MALYRVLSMIDETLETFESDNDEAAKEYAASEHQDYGYLLQRLNKQRKETWWSEVEFVA